PTGRGVPAVGVVPVLEVRPVAPSGADDCGPGRPGLGRGHGREYLAGGPGRDGRAHDRRRPGRGPAPAPAGPTGRRRDVHPGGREVARGAARIDDAPARVPGEGPGLLPAVRCRRGPGPTNPPRSDPGAVSRGEDPAEPWTECRGRGRLPK